MPNQALGVVIMVSGALLVVGGFTGNLPAILAALFYPQALVPA